MVGTKNAMFGPHLWIIERPFRTYCADSKDDLHTKEGKSAIPITYSDSLLTIPTQQTHIQREYREVLSIGGSAGWDNLSLTWDSGFGSMYVVFVILVREVRACPRFAY